MSVTGFLNLAASGTYDLHSMGTRMSIESIFEWLQNNLHVLVTAGSAVFAVAGAILARAETRKQREIQIENLRHSIDAQSLAWGNSSIDVLNRAAMFARTRQHQTNDASFFQQRVNLMLALSTLVERGRLFFPNVDSDRKGAEKEGAYRGSRPPILDALMFAYYELDALTRTEGPTADNSAAFIEDCRRLLVSELQAHVAPNRRDAMVGRYDDQRLEHRKDALLRSDTLKARLQARRPNIKIDQPHETRQ